MMKLSKLFESFISNRYLYAYENLMEKAKNQNRKRGSVYYELHHIIPKSIAPEFTNLSKHRWNGALLTAKEHFIAHRLLCKFTIGDARISMLRAYNAVCHHTRRTGYTPTSLQYRIARESINLAAKLASPRESRVPKWSNCNTMKDFEDMMTRLVGEGISDPEIGSQFGISSNAIHAWRRKLKLNKRRPLLRNKEWLHEQYVVLMRTADQIAKELNCTGSAVQQYLHKYSIPVRIGNTKLHQNSLLYDREWLRKQFVDENRTKISIAAEIGCSRTYLAEKLIQFNIHRPND